VDSGDEATKVEKFDANADFLGFEDEKVKI